MNEVTRGVVIVVILIVVGFLLYQYIQHNSNQTKFAQCIQSITDPKTGNVYLDDGPEAADCLRMYPTN